MITNDSVPRNGAIVNQENGGNNFECELCDRTFTTKIGLSQHIRLTHPVEYNARINVERVKPRWGEEEMDRMASEEARAIREGGVRFMNQHLHAIFPERTLGSIKSRRKSDEYKARVQRLSNSEQAEDIAIVEGIIIDGQHEAQDIDQVSNLMQGVEGEIQFESQNEIQPTIVEPILDGNTQSIGAVDEIQIDLYKVALKNQVSVCIRGLVGNTLSSTQRLIAIANKILNNEPLENNALYKWLKSVFRHARLPKSISIRQRNNSDDVLRGSRNSIRRQEYAIIQKLYKRDFRSSVKRVLQDGADDTTLPPKDEVIAFWRRIFNVTTLENDELNDIDEDFAYEENALLQGVWSPITEDDVRQSELDLDSAAGPDGVTVANWRGICVKVRSLFFNLILLQGSLDAQLKRARTILIPKSSGNVGAGDMRPLSITSVSVRQLHKMFAKRFKHACSFNPSQRAFIDCDGTLENISIVTSLLSDARMSRKEVHVATLDMRKAFDSVSHKAIIDTIKALKCPKPFVEYIRLLYTDSKTTLQYDSSNTILDVKQGVLQGDPISPLLFNAVLDRALAKIPGDIGYKLNGVKINCVAYADDIILVASTRGGLQKSIDMVLEELSLFGLRINAEKSSTLSLMPSGREKKVKVIDFSMFQVDGVLLKATGVIETWKYLGIHFTGSRISEKSFDLSSDLEKISKAPLKPFQRLRMLNQAVLPKHLHGLILGRVSAQKLKNLDLIVRRYIKRWLFFPQDVPNAYLYASVKDGGLGIFNLSQQVPLIRKTRLLRFLSNDHDDTAQALNQSIYIKRQLEWCNARLSEIGDNVTKNERSQFWRDVLSGMVDTNDLKDASFDKASNCWVYERASEISGRDYIRYHHVRAGCLPTRARTNRGRQNDRLCRAGCGGSETNYHVIQQCQRTHGGRVLRHDRVVNLLFDHLRHRPGVEVIKEPRFKTRIGLRKPDLLISKKSKYCCSRRSGCKWAKHGS